MEPPSLDIVLPCLDEAARAAVGARPHPGRRAGHRGRQRLAPTARRTSPARAARSSSHCAAARVRRRLPRRPGRRDRRVRRVLRLRRLARPGRRAAAWSRRCAAGADLAVGRRRADHAARLAAARPGRQPRAGPPGAPAHRRSPCATSARCGWPAASRCWRWASRDRRSGYPVETVRAGRATPAGRSSASTSPTAPRAGRSKVTGTVRGTRAGGARHERGAARR